MSSISGPRLPVTKDLITDLPPVNLVAILHALRDSGEFLEHMKNANHGLPDVFAKPYSKNPSVIADIRDRLGITMVEEGYDVLENTDILRDSIARAQDKASANVVIVDVGGYFAKPLERITQDEPELLPRGVVEITTFGHNRYVKSAPNIDRPILSVARSPLKDVESVFVGESAWLGVDKVLRDIGRSAFGKKVGMVGYGMIGRRVAAAAKSSGTHTRVYDSDAVKLLDARSYKHELRFSLGELLADSDIVIASTGGTSIPVDEIVEHAKDGIILGSAGSKLQEIDMPGLQRLATKVERINENLEEFTMPNGKRIYVMRGGSSLNFLIGSCPDETMDIVFAEVVQGINSILTGNLPRGVINEVSHDVRKKIAAAWLRLH